MPTPKSLRAAPDRTFENYILTLSRGVSNSGLTKVPQELFAQIPGGPGTSDLDEGYNEPLDIGFPFQFDGRTHIKFVASTNGYIILVAPGKEASSAATILSEVFTGSSFVNTLISPTFSENHVLFAVWFDDLVNTAQSVSDLGLSTTVQARYELGLSQPDIRLNPRKYGVQYYVDNKSQEGRRLIIRWNSISHYNAENTVLRYDLVLYENGKVEYRYDKRESFGSSSADEDATIGVFMPGGTWRFRDFSYELGYDTKTRTRYSLGGTISGSYVDSADGNTVPYGANLKPQTYWPGQKDFGAVFTFQPPLNRRKVLPRLSIREKDSRSVLPTVARTGDRDRSGAEITFFDDRKTLNYKTRNDINFPSMLPRFYASDINEVVRNQNLFSEDLIFTGSIISSNVQEYLENDEKSYISPFSEHKLFENDPGSNSNSFFTVGSSVSDVGEGFKQPLKSKTQIRLSYRVDHKTRMFEASSSIYYFNGKTGRWQYPTSSFANGRFDIPDTRNHYTASYSGVSYGRMVEVDRGFNAFGFNIASGSSTSIDYRYRGTDGYIGSVFNKENRNSAITKTFDNSIQVNPLYSATSDETLTLPIQQPFLLEKAVIELPIEAGPGWFNDKTKCFIPLTTNSPYYPFVIFSAFDVGGPGLTVSLFNQVSLGPGKTRRDLILSGTITHEFDDIAEIVYSNTPDIPVGGNLWNPVNGAGRIWQVVPRGFRAYGTPTAVISGTNPSGNYSYTGSVQLNCTAEVSNGFLIRDSILVNQGYTLYPQTGNLTIAKANLDYLFNTPFLPLPTSEVTVYNPAGGNAGFRYTGIFSINNFGRGCVGFQPSGRSILGKEYTTTNENDSIMVNPFYTYKDQNVLTNLKNALPGTADASDVVILSSIVQKSKSVPSPYLLLPGDKLILAVSKSRPVFFSTTIGYPHTSGSIKHDIKLTTGSINITLYGSLVSNGSEFHDTLNQSLSSDAIHEVVIGGTNT